MEGPSAQVKEGFGVTGTPYYVARQDCDDYVDVYLPLKKSGATKKVRRRRSSSTNPCFSQNLV